MILATSHCSDETHFSVTLAGLKDSDCGLVATSPEAHSIITVVKKAKTMDWDTVDFIAPVSISYHCNLNLAPLKVYML